jgi:thioredoxin 1
MIKTISSKAGFTQQITKAEDGLVRIVDFYATWCPPCKMVKPLVEEFAEIYQDNVIIYQVDTDKMSSLAESFDIGNIPTFVFFKDGKEIDRQVGPNPITLEAMIKKSIA